MRFLFAEDDNSVRAIVAQFLEEELRRITNPTKSKQHIVNNQNFNNLHPL